jgi:uncharacterized repeat protein (TIGR01451 family)
LWNSPTKITYVYNNTNFTNYLGNYWDDYNGFDNNTDGIGDTPYDIGVSTEKDKYPLVKRIVHYQLLPSWTKVKMVETYSNHSKKMVSIAIHKATINATITGDFNGTINFTGIELVMITSGSFAGSGFFRRNFTAKIENEHYHGKWQGMLFNKSNERKYYLKGTLFGGIWGITDGYLEESNRGSGNYDTFNSTSTICRLGEDITFAELTLNGTMSVQNATNSKVQIYILQALFSGNATGFYNKSLSVVITHIRINTKSNEFYGFGFTTLSYVSAWGSGSGWTYDRTIETKLVNLTGFFTPPLWGFVFGELNETGKKRTLSITIIRLDLGSKPAPNVKVDVWGPRLASPGQKINYFVQYMNIGLKAAVNTEIVLMLSTNVTYLNNTHDGTYNNITHSVTWKYNISAKSRKIVSVKGKLKWGLKLGTNVTCTAYIRDYIKNETLASHNWSIFLTLAIDPNMKHGPEGNVTPGQKLEYKIEFENIGKGIAYGVYFTDILSEYLDASTLKMGPVISSQDSSIISTTGIYDPAVRTITWFAGEVGPGCGGYAEFSINVRSDAPLGSAILNYGTVYFPSVPEITKTNGIVSIVRENIGPTAMITGNKLVRTFDNLVLSGSKSIDPDGEITSYDWDFGDGTFGNGKEVTHSYKDDGDYPVILTVKDEFDFTDSHKINVQVQNRPPLAKLRVDHKDIKTLEMIFNANSSSDLDGAVIEYNFDFGDGSTSGWVQTPFISHKYADSNKIYTVKLQVRDDDGELNKNMAELNIAINYKPIPKLTVEPTEAYTYSDIVISGELSTDSDGSVTSYYFDFGDGENSGWITTPFVSHQYLDGTKKYSISLKVKDNYDALSEEMATAEILIKNRLPVPSLTVEKSEVHVFEEVLFDASGSYDLDGEELEYYFDFGDGTNSGWIVNSDIKHKYSNGPQEYNVELRVKDSDGEIGSTDLLISVLNQLPIAQAGPDLTVQINQEVIFDASGSYDPEGNILTYKWNFGDDITTEWLNSAETTHSYTEPGEFTVTLSVSDGSLIATDSCLVLVEDISKKDTDGDGVPDELDAFPLDAAASVDSDNDNYPDHWNPGMTKDDSTTGLKLDEYPNDPEKYKDEAIAKSSSERTYLIATIIIFLIILLIVIFSLVIRKNKNKRIPRPFDSDDYIRELRDRTIQGDRTEASGLTGTDLLEKINTKYQNGEISKEVYEAIKQEKLN